MNTTRDTSNFPAETNRAEWARILELPPWKLVHEQRSGRLRPTRRMGYNVLFSREEIIRWLAKYN